MPEQALTDVKVLDLTWHIAGPYGTKLFADYGAEVIKIEQPGEGDPGRQLAPFYHDDPDPEKSGFFMFLNTNKKSITLNLKSESGKKIFKELVEDVDIVIENFRPHVMPSLGLSYEELEKINPKLVMTSLSNFGQTGPYREYKSSDMILQAMGHSMYCRGLPDREPQQLATNAMLYQGGNIAAMATMFAFYGARYKGIGQHVDVSIMECGLSAIDMRAGFLLGYQYTGGMIATREPLAVFGILPMGIYPCEDGFVDFSATPQHWPRVVKMLEMPELVEQFPNILDISQKDEFEAILRVWMLDRKKQDIMEKGQAEKVYVVAMKTPGDLVEDKHFRERKFWAEIDHPMTGKLTYPGAPFVSEETPWMLKKPAPLPGQHNVDIYCDRLGYSREELVRLRETGVI